MGRDDGGGSTVDIANTVHVGACLPLDHRLIGWHIDSVGSPLDARHVAIIIPGVSNNYGTFPKLLENARNLYGEIRRLYPASSASTAVIAWLGYNPPDGATLPQAAMSDIAADGATNLTAFIRPLARVSLAAPGFDLTVIGHS